MSGRLPLSTRDTLFEGSLSLFLFALLAAVAHAQLRGATVTASWITRRRRPLRNPSQTDGVPFSLVAHGATDNRDRLCVSGEPVSTGAAHTEPEHGRIGTMNTAPHFEAGHIALAAVVRNSGLYSPMARHASDRAGQHEAPRPESADREAAGRPTSLACLFSSLYLTLGQAQARINQ